MILERQDRAGWGAKMIDRLPTHLRESFPAMKAFRSRNLKYMRALAAQVFTDPHILDVLGTADPRRVREVERALPGGVVSTPGAMPSSAQKPVDQGAFHGGLDPCLRTV